MPGDFDLATFVPDPSRFEADRHAAGAARHLAEDVAAGLRSPDLPNNAGPRHATVACADPMGDFLARSSGSASSSGLSVVEQALRTSSDEQRRMMDIASGKIGTFGGALESLKGVRGMDGGILAMLKGQAGVHDTATRMLEKRLSRARDGDPFRSNVLDRHGPLPLRPMSRNPIHETNVLLDEVRRELAEQRVLVEASVAAQTEETRLITQLVEAFVTSQAASDEHARRSQRQAWIGIAVAVAFGVMPIVMLIAGMG